MSVVVGLWGSFYLGQPHTHTYGGQVVPMELARTLCGLTSLRVLWLVPDNEAETCAKLLAELDAEYIVIPQSRAASAVADFQPIAVMDHSGMGLVQLAALRAASRVDFRIVGLHHALSYPAHAQYYLHVGASDLTEDDTLFVASSASLSVLQAMFADLGATLRAPSWPTLRLLPLGIRRDFFRPFDSGDSRELLNLPLTTPLLLWVGRLSSYDKIDVTLLSECLAAVPDAKLVLQGTDVERGYFDDICDRQRLKERVIRTSFERDLLPRLYSACDLLVAPADSVQESYGLVVAEAQACGTVVVASAWDGYKDLVVNGETGVLVPTHWDNDVDTLSESMAWLPNVVSHAFVALAVHVDREAFVASVTQLLSDGTRRARLGQRAREASKRFDARHVAEAYCAEWLRPRDVAGSPNANSPWVKLGWFRGYVSEEVCACKESTTNVSPLPPVPQLEADLREDGLSKALVAAWKRKQWPGKSSDPR